MSAAKVLRICLGVGFALWLVAMFVFRFAGHLFFIPENTVGMAVLFALTIPVAIFITFVVFLLLRIPPSGHPPAAIALVIPGMFLDAAVLPFWPAVFPNMSAGAAPYFGGWMLLAYASVLLTTYILRRKKK